MSSKNKWRYADYLEEALDKPEQAEMVRAMSLVDWDRLAPRAMAFMADRLAAESRARQPSAHAAGGIGRLRNRAPGPSKSNDLHKPHDHQHQLATLSSIW